MMRKNCSRLTKTNRYILLLESSTTNCSVGISCDNTMLAYKEVNKGFTHAENMPAFVEDILGEADISSSHISAIALSLGPGSYTGLRIGASLAKGLSFGWGIPILGIDSTLVLAATYNKGMKALVVSAREGIVAMMDSRAGEVYAGAYTSELEETIAPRPVRVGIDDADFLELLRCGSVCIGPGAQKYSEIITVFPEVFPSVIGMVNIACAQFLSGKFLNSAYFEPAYMKDFAGVSTCSARINS